uniref:Uncharacterized protein n=1 Tax=Ciona intestinalis TaxID=7719 RepID=H2Y373_CIOIN
MERIVTSSMVEGTSLILTMELEPRAQVLSRSEVLLLSSSLRSRSSSLLSLLCR